MSDALRMTPETLADAILQAAGSGLRHHTPQSRAAILAAAERCIKDIREEAYDEGRDDGRDDAINGMERSE